MHHFPLVVASINILDIGTRWWSRELPTIVMMIHDLPFCRGGWTNPYTGSLLDDCSLQVAFKVLVYGLFRPNPILHGAASMQLSAYLWDWIAYLNLRYKTCNITWRSWNVPLHHIMCPTHGHKHLNLHKPTTHVSVLQLSLAFQGSSFTLSESYATQPACHYYLVQLTSSHGFPMPPRCAPNAQFGPSPCDVA